MKLTDVIAVWDILHVQDTGKLGFCDLEAAIDATVGVENDVPGCQPQPITLPPEPPEIREAREEEMRRLGLNTNPDGSFEYSWGPWS